MTPSQLVALRTLLDLAAQHLRCPVIIEELAPLLDEPTAPQPQPECTGLTAAWCPIHGDCKCPDDGAGERTLDDPGCPLHAAEATHAEPAQPVKLEWQTVDAFEAIARISDTLALTAEKESDDAEVSVYINAFGPTLDAAKAEAEAWVAAKLGGGAR